MLSYKSAYFHEQSRLKNGTLILRFHELDSTNLEAERLAGTLAPEHLPLLDKGIAIVANRQTAGMGQFGRTWVSEKGGLYYSLLIHCPAADADDYRKYVEGTGKVAAYELHTWTSLGFHIDPPNDIMTGHRKIGGVLLRRMTVADRPCMIVGIGINVNQKLFPPEIADTATSLYRETRIIRKRIELARRLSEALVGAFLTDYW